MSTSPNRHPVAELLITSAHPHAVRSVERRVVRTRRRRAELRSLARPAVVGLAIVMAAVWFWSQQDAERPTGVVVAEHRRLQVGQQLDGPQTLRFANKGNMHLADRATLVLAKAETDLATWRLSQGQVELSWSIDGVQQQRVLSPHAVITLVAGRARIAVSEDQTNVVVYRGRAVVAPLAARKELAPVEPGAGRRRAARCAQRACTRGIDRGPQRYDFQVRGGDLGSSAYQPTNTRKTSGGALFHVG